MEKGDIVEIKTKEEIFAGRLMPNSDKEKVILKLNSGYNLGLSREKIIKIKVVKKSTKKRKKKGVILHKKNLKKVLILHTGGTIASEADYETGGVIAKFSPEEIVSKFPEIQEIVNVESKLVGNLFSEDMNFNHYNVIAREILKASKKFDGIIITHGTDTMHYTSAALSFVLEDLNFPVLLVGSQRSSDRGSSDAGMNLICACHFIAKSKFSEVGICMHENMDDENCVILPGLKARKMHSSRRDAFKVVNGKILAVVRKDGFIDYESKYREIGERSLKLRPFKDVKVGFLKVHPNMKVSEIKMFSSFDGLIIEGFGIAGNMPINVSDKFTKENGLIYSELVKLGKKIPIVATSQTIFGRINMNVYTTGRLIQEAAILGNYSSMTPETSFIKLAWLLSNYPKRVKELFSEDFRGEFSVRIGPEFLED